MPDRPSCFQATSRPGQLFRGRHPLGLCMVAADCVRSKGCLINHLPQFPVVKSRAPHRSAAGHWRLWTRRDVNNLTSRVADDIEVTSRRHSTGGQKNSSSITSDAFLSCHWRLSITDAFLKVSASFYSTNSPNVTHFQKHIC